MKKLLNTLYVSDENAYLSCDGDTVVCKSEGKPELKLPLLNLESICCFSYIGCSPALMGKCVERGVALSFFTPGGKFLARVSGRSQGNVYTRVRQNEVFSQNALALVRNTVAVKLSNTRQLVERSLRDHPENEAADKLFSLSQTLKRQIDAVYECKDIDAARGIEGSCANAYFESFNALIRNKNEAFIMHGRSKHPPFDAVNALLSFLYAMMTNDLVSALESVGLDSCMGFYHTLRPGRASLACDLVEEVRCIAERVALTLINLKILNEKDFDRQLGGAVYLNDDGRKKVLAKWQEKKREEFKYPVLNQKVQYGLLPFIQANLLAKYVRGEIDEYPPFIMR